MTEAELAEQITNYGNQGLSAFTVWVSVVAGYLVAAYTSGSKLNSSQVLILNSLYLFVSALLIFAIWSSFKVQAFYAVQIREAFPGSPQTMNFYVAAGLTLTTACASLASVKFLWDIRHR